jgi:hypothetical protein
MEKNPDKTLEYEVKVTPEVFDSGWGYFSQFWKFLIVLERVDQNRVKILYQ